MGLFTASLAKANSEIQNSEDVLGEFSWDDWKQINGISDAEADDYNLDDLSLDMLKEVLKRKNIVFNFFIASWCGDSRAEFPIVMRILNLCEVSEKRIRLLAVSRDKMTPNEAFINNIDSVPTLQILSYGYEIGRIEENPAVSWEYDILRILTVF